MIISKRWLSQYIDMNDMQMDEVAKKITNAGLEVETIEYASYGTNLVIGKVLECLQHPNSDHLHVCKVDIGNEILPIVCGAPNVAINQKVIVAKVGAQLKEIQIKLGNIRGEESCGMICSLLELGVDEKLLSDEQKAGIEVLPVDAPIGNEDPLAYLGYDDVILDIGLTPNRSDCLAAWSMALEVGAILNREVVLPTLVDSKNMGDKTTLHVSSETSKSSLLLGKKIGNVKIKPSIEWMAKLLQSAGIKPINNVVDISNYVMLETGQPLHFYDHRAISDYEITVRDDYEGSYEALDGVTYELVKGDVVITTNHQVIGIAGIMGGDSSKIQEDTSSIVIEAAAFHHVAIRNTSKRLHLNTDASIRFQKGIDPLAPYKAMDRAISLLIEYADAKLIETTSIYDKSNYQPTVIPITVDAINKLLGTNFTEMEVLNVFTRLGFHSILKQNIIYTTIPSYRTDLHLECDLVEEVIRILGYDTLVSTLPKMVATLGELNERQALRRYFKRSLCDLGYQEAITYSLISKEQLEDAIMPHPNPIELASFMSEEHRYMRSSILPSLLESVAYNQARSVESLAFFEISQIYAKDIMEERLAIIAYGTLQQNAWQKEIVTTDFYTLKGIVEVLLEKVGIQSKRLQFKTNTMDHQHFHPYKSAEVYIGKDLLGIVGQIHPQMAKTYDVDEVYMLEMNLESILSAKKSKIKYEEISKFPQITRDYAFIMQDDIAIGNVTSEIYNHGKLNKENIIIDVEVFDVYQGEHIAQGYQSIALRVTFESKLKTLSEEDMSEVEGVMLATLKKKYQIELRN